MIRRSFHLALRISSIFVGILYSISCCSDEYPNIRGWIGAETSELYFDESLVGFDNYRSREKNCDVSNVMTCDAGQFSSITEPYTKVQDTSLTQSRNAYFVVANGNIRNEQLIRSSGGSSGQRASHDMIEFDGELWVVGGKICCSSNYRDDIWSSSDGITWVERVARPPFEEREGHQLVVFNGRIWLIGGSNSDYKNGFNDVWSSLDGINWRLENDNAPFGPRFHHRTVVYNERIWLVGGRNKDQEFSDIWSSEDGVNWTLVSSESNFSPRYGHELVVFDDKILMIGGTDISLQFNNEVWSTSDGINWSQEASNTEFSARFSHQVAEHDGRLWLVGGFTDDGISGDVWSSVDGISWTKVVEDKLSTRLWGHRVSSFKGNLVLTGGRVSGSGYRIKGVVSSDGFSWNYMSTNSSFPSISSPKVLVDGGKLWMLDNSEGVWSTSTGLDWERAADPEVFSSRSIIDSAVKFRNKFWVFIRSKIWSSEDGTNWQIETTGAEFGDRYGYSLSVHNEKLVLIGGYQGSYSTGRHLNDIWASENGIDWMQVVASAEFTPRRDHAVANFKNKLWLVGGTSDFQIGNHSDEVWSSSDGMNWTLETTGGEIDGRSKHTLTVIEDRLYLLGGYNDRYGTPARNWFSVDGRNWSSVDLPSLKSLVGHDVASFDGYIWVLGGASDEIWRSADMLDWKKFYQGRLDTSDSKYHISSISRGVRTNGVQGDGGTFSPEKLTLAVGQSGSISILPYKNYDLYDVEGCNGELVDYEYFIGSVNSNCTIEARFIRTYDVTASASGAGSITPNSLNVREGEVVEFFAEPSSWWYKLGSIDGCSGTLDGDDIFRAVIFSDCHVTASFVPWWSW